LYLIYRQKFAHLLPDVEQASANHHQLKMSGYRQDRYPLQQKYHHYRMYEFQYSFFAPYYHVLVDKTFISSFNKLRIFNYPFMNDLVSTPLILETINPG